MHIPVLSKEVLEYLEPKENENFVDCTFGFGGHTKEILSKTGPNGKVLAIELDKELSEKVEDSRIVIVNDSYTNLINIINEKKFYPVSGILFDFGMSSFHIDKSGRGFSFLKDEPLDMRYNIKNNLRAEEVINNYSIKEIENILKEYGEERFAKNIALKIIERRKREKIKTTTDLVNIIKLAIPFKYRKQKIHFATRTFQALRIAVNDELKNIEKGLNSAIELIPKNGRITAISFHSLEDRIVKNIFKKEKGLKILTKKPITAGFEEIKNNHRARSAKLRAVIKN